MKLIWGMLLALLFALPACGDTVTYNPNAPNILIAQYEVSGSGVLVGNDVCGGRPCVEAFSFSIIADEELTWFGDYVLGNEPNPVLTSTGPLGRLNYVGFQYNYLALGFQETPTNGAEVDMFMGWNDSNSPFVPQISGANELYACGDAQCMKDFNPPPGSGNGGGNVGYVPGGLNTVFLGGATGSGNVIRLVSTPEPGSLALVALGMAALGFLGWQKRTGNLNQL